MSTITKVSINFFYKGNDCISFEGEALDKTLFAEDIKQQFEGIRNENKIDELFNWLNNFDTCYTSPSSVIEEIKQKGGLSNTSGIIFNCSYNNPYEPELSGDWKIIIGQCEENCCDEQDAITPIDGPVKIKYKICYDEHLDWVKDYFEGEGIEIEWVDKYSFFVILDGEQKNEFEEWFCWDNEIEFECEICPIN